MTMEMKPQGKTGGGGDGLGGWVDLEGRGDPGSSDASINS